jgi:signal transduction histidine kinase
VETNDGDLWLNGLSGIFHISRSEVAQALKTPGYPAKGERYGRREGLPGFASQSRPLPSAIEGTDGRLWFSVNNGLFWLDPRHAQNKVAPPPITIQSVSGDDKNYESGPPLSFPPRTGSVQFNYSAVSLSDPDAIRYRYKLAEIEKDWHEASTANPVTYRNLPPGSYHFLVAASDTNGEWPDKVATAEFTILPAFYQTMWFRSLCVLVLGSLIAGLFQLRLRQLAQQYSIRMEERVSERTRIAQDLHDTLLQGFISASLQLSLADRELTTDSTAKPIVSEVLKLMKTVIEEGRRAVRGMRLTQTDGGDLETSFSRISAETITDEPVNFRVQAEGTARALHALVRDDVYRIGREAIINAFRHSDAANVEVELRYSDRDLRLFVRDDGRGIEPEVLRDGRDGHWGLSGMRETAEKIGATLRLQSRPGEGTEVELRVPAGIAFATSPRPPARRWRHILRPGSRSKEQSRNSP